MTLDKLAAAFACALLDKSGHFAAWEQPELLSHEVRAGFRSLR
jgi:pimeloyl-ACP methyl ester carboxylesterase